MKKSLDEVRAYAERIAEKKGWKLTGRRDMLEHLLNGLMENFNRYGYYNCPCRDSQDDRKKDRDIICPCLYAREHDVDEHGYCYCALFFRKDFDPSQPIKMIPDRHEYP
jgi:ferredoxin-thioredoxin reductase catalytic subunit